MIAVKPLAPDSLYLCGTPVRIKIMTNEPGSTAGRKTMPTLVGPSHFPTTRWTLVVAAANPQRKEARSALVSLCEGYWYPYRGSESSDTFYRVVAVEPRALSFSISIELLPDPVLCNEASV